MLPFSSRVLPRPSTRRDRRFDSDSTVDRFVPASLWVSSALANLLLRERDRKGHSARPADGHHSKRKPSVLRPMLSQDKCAPLSPVLVFPALTRSPVLLSFVTAGSLRRNRAGSLLSLPCAQRGGAQRGTARARLSTSREESSLLQEGGMLRETLAASRPLSLKSPRPRMSPDVGKWLQG